MIRVDIQTWFPVKAKSSPQKAWQYNWWCTSYGGYRYAKLFQPIYHALDFVALEIDLFIKGRAILIIAPGWYSVANTFICLAAEAAVTGTQAFFTFSSQVGKDVWLEKLCQISSQAGCNLDTLGAACLWESLGEEPFEIQATAKAVEKVHKSKTAR